MVTDETQIRKAAVNRRSPDASRTERELSQLAADAQCVSRKCILLCLGVRTRCGLGQAALLFICASAMS